MWETRDLRRDVGSWCLLRQSQEGAVVDVIIKTMTVEDIERLRAEIKKIIQTPEFQERVRENALLRRERALFDELEDLDFLQYGSSAAS